MKSLFTAILLFTTLSANASSFLSTDDRVQKAKDSVVAIEASEELGEAIIQITDVRTVGNNAIMLTSTKTFRDSDYSESSCWEVEFGRGLLVNSVARLSETGCSK